MTPDISVLLPVRNAAATLGIALRSILRSRGVHFEVVAVDHGSTDESARILRSHGARVSVVDGAAAPDLSRALELGRARCRAPFIARMDADDVMHPARLARDLAHLRASPALAAVASRVKLIPRHRTTPGMRAYVAWQNACLTPAEHARDIWIEQPLCHPATTFRASTLADAGGWRAPAHVPEDYELFLRLIARGHALEKRADVHHAWRQHAHTGTRFSRDTLAQLKAAALAARFALADKRVVVAGAGKEGGRIARALLAHGVRPAAFVDVNPARVGRRRHGVPVHDARELANLRETGARAFVVAAVGTSGSRGVVRAQLAHAGFTESVDAVVVA